MGGLGRRDFLRAGGAGILAFSLPAGFLRCAFAGDGTTPKLVVLYLRGGMDALNAVVPHGDPRYYDYRPTLAIRPGSEREKGVIDLDGTFGLHPSLAALKPLWDAGKLAAVVNAGSPHPTRSHFDAQDFMEYAAPGLRTVRDGWLNRYLDQSRAARAAELRGVAMQRLLPRSLRGEYPAVAVPDDDVLRDTEMLETFGALHRRDEASADDVRATGRQTVAALARLRELIGSGAATDGRYPAGPLGTKLRALARIVRAEEGLEIAALDLGGWDTHANQGALDGAMPRLLGQLAESVAAFLDDLGPLAGRTLVVTMTEFGRTCRENGNYGTDHGHGGLMLLAGGQVAGGRIHGSWTGLAERSLYEGRDLKVTTDFRDVFAEILRSHFRFRPPDDFFPGYRPRPVRGLFG